MTIVFPGLRCEMVLVVASIGSEGLLGTEALQLCLPHQLDLRMGQLWADGQSTLQLLQEQQTARASAHVKGSLVMPPNSEMVAPVSIRSQSGIPPGRCSMIEPDLDITESFGVLVGRTLVDASDCSASVLLINPSSDVVVLPSFLCVGTSVPVLAVWVAQTVVIVPEANWALPEHLEDTHYNIETSGARPVQCGPCRLAPACLRTEHIYIKEMLEGGQIEPSDGVGDEKGWLSK